MARRDHSIGLRHMLDHAKAAVDFVSNQSFDSFSCNLMLQFALIHSVQVIGEAANRLPPSLRDQYPEIPWRNVIGMRNRLVHGYDVIDLKVLWDTTREDLPALILLLEKSIAPHNSGDS